MKRLSLVWLLVGTLLFGTGWGGFAAGQGMVIIEPPVTIIVPPTPTPRPRPQPVPQLACLQLKQHQVTVTIKDQVATTRIEHIFHNPTGSRLEGTFIFPLPRDANINRFEMDVNGKMTEAELLDAQRARQIYEDIVRSMRDPALLEYAENGLLKARIFPIEPRSDKHVTLEYTQLLTADTGTVAYSYPLTARTMQGSQLGKLALKLTLETTRPLANVYCPSHAVEIKRHGDRKAIIGYESDRLGESDLQLYFSTQKPGADEAVGLTLLTYRDGHPDVLGSTDGYFMLLASPLSTPQRKALPKDVVFVIDTSGSMQGAKLAQAKKALSFCIENLHDQDRFQIVRFSTDAEALFDAMRPADAEHREKAYAFVESLRPIGGTAIEDALNLAIAPALAKERRDASRPYYVIFLTDGRPTIGQTDTNRLIESTLTSRDAHKHVRVFSFGIGTDINTRLLDQISQTTRGVTEYVLPDEDIEIKVSRFFTKISEPVLANPTLAVTGDIRLLRTYPRDLPDLFFGDQLIVIGRYTGKGDAAMTLSGAMGDQAHKVVDDVSFAEQAIDHAFIPRLWATRRVGYLLDEVRLRGENAELKDEIVKLARAYGIVTPYTSYLIVEDEARRNVPVASRTMQEFEVDRDRVQTAGRAYRQMATAEAGESAIRGSQSNDALKLAAMPAPQAAADYAQLGADALADGRAVTGRRVELTQQSMYRNGKTFVRNGEQWIDAEAQTSRAQELRVERVAFNSPRYFEIVRENKDVAQWMSVGSSLQLVLRDRVVEVYVDG